VPVRADQLDADHPVRSRVVWLLSLVEDVAYIGLGVLLAVSALALLIVGGKTFVSALMTGNVGTQMIGLLDQILLVLLVVELLYTVQVSFREHGLVAEPFLIVALIAVIRRILVLTAEIPKLPQADEAVFRRAITELSLLSVMIAVLVGSFVVLQKHGKKVKE
jgi:uncharacterized membrane protein (DUF373 family)